jgi:hypothetical protein
VSKQRRQVFTLFPTHHNPLKETGQLAYAEIPHLGDAPASPLRYTEHGGYGFALSGACRVPVQLLSGAPGEDHGIIILRLAVLRVEVPVFGFHRRRWIGGGFRDAQTTYLTRVAAC